MVYPASHSPTLMQKSTRNSVASFCEMRSSSFPSETITSTHWLMNTLLGEISSLNVGSALDVLDSKTRISASNSSISANVNCVPSGSVTNVKSAVESAL